MKGDTRAARRYARAIFQMALKREEVDVVASGLAQVALSEDASPQLMTVLQHPRITRERKKELLKQVFGDSVPADVANFLTLLVDKDRADILPEVAIQFRRLLDENRKQLDAEATTAIPMSDAQRDALLNRLQAQTGYTIRLQTRVDESIVGGLIVRVGDRLIDGSVRTQLQTMREQLKQAKVI